MRAQIFTFTDFDGVRQYATEAHKSRFSFFFSPSIEYLARTCATVLVEYGYAEPAIPSFDFGVYSHSKIIRGAQVSCFRLSADEQKKFGAMFGAAVQQCRNEWAVLNALVATGNMF